MIRTLKLIVAAAAASALLPGQFYYQGTARIQGIYTNDPVEEIPLPFRALELEAGLNIGDFQLNTQSSMEVLWADSGTEAHLRECYFSWYPSFGEISIGKQLLTWGMADSNNPTDNLSPYDFNYLFETGVERKRGTLAGRVMMYWHEFQIEAVWLPNHEPHRLVKDPSFPIRPEYPPGARFNKPEDINEYGIRIQSMLESWDWAVSWLSAHDRLLTPEALVSGQGITQFNYRNTDVLGLDLVGLYGDFIFRNELGWFFTRTRDADEMAVLVYNEIPAELTADYVEYTFQLEYIGIDDVTIIAQLIGLEVNEVDADIPLIKAGFVPGLGMPFVQLSDRIAMASFQKTFYDPDLEIKIALMGNLVNQGGQAGLNIKYSPYQNWNTELTVGQFFGDSGKPDEYIFNSLEAFSNFTVSLSYSF